MWIKCLWCFQQLGQPQTETLNLLELSLETGLVCSELSWTSCTHKDLVLHILSKPFLEAELTQTPRASPQESWSVLLLTD